MEHEQVLDKFKHVVATTSLKNIATALSHALEHVLIFKPQLEAMVTLRGQIVFREDWHYYTEVNGIRHCFDPFVSGGDALGNVYCEENRKLRLTKKFLDSVWHTLNYEYITNPLLHVMIADYLTFTLNEEQEWARSYSNLQMHFMQNYIDLDKLVKEYAPEAFSKYASMIHDVSLARVDFMTQLSQDKVRLNQSISEKEALAMYEARGKQYEDTATQDFWDLPAIRAALQEIMVAVSRVIISLFPTVRAVTEKSIQAIYGYDVFHVSVLAETEIVVKSLGDYRILHWELQQ